jgi:hypothetical protein
MKFLKNLIIFFGTILIYLHIYIHFKITSLNEFTEIKYNNDSVDSVDDLSKQKIMTTIYYKLPFVFDGTSILKPFDIKNIKRNSKDSGDQNKESVIKIKKIKHNCYQKTYEKMALLEPSVRFFTKNTVYELKKNKKIDIHHNLECRNFYLLHSGKVIVYCIHPKYKDLTIESIEKNEDILRVEMHPNSILFIPNYWNVYIKGIEKSVIEKVQYKTILNEANFLYDRCKGYFLK